MNTEVYNEIRSALKTQLNDKVPNPIPVIEVNPKQVKNSLTTSGILVNGTSQPVALPTGKDLYIIGASIKWVKDATSTSTYSSITYTSEDGAVLYLLRNAHLTLTAEAGSNSITFPHPIKVKRDTQLAILSSTNVANISVSAVINYFVDDSSNA